MNVFRLEGEYWTVKFQQAVFRLRDGKGLRYLAYLLHHPGEEVGAEDLIWLVAGDEIRSSTRSTRVPPEATPGIQAERARSAVSKRIKSALQRIQSHNPALSRHLARSIKTGRVCGYLPDADQPITWAK